MRSKECMIRASWGLLGKDPKLSWVHESTTASIIRLCYRIKPSESRSQINIMINSHSPASIRSR
ncbi:hypothetical protein CC1G_15069 [Coprinopsis cinerea okayama7|uniref:Uncharacterized protein n=1 Tax=Coprinopsis cinerea (strain Okayama-7 / 130 / ATCC MYA-4618 / FGSC 9003) TaxID=240176 RepID=D6RP83_COPC7|nr:hypothetical protein CC1G_15069 [Coprinopsis cinerea okayama7\|eukprot:XP_002910735.1 hypothetical protein CC1G_15069 [Coprinopsis cinerea okayama7\